MHLAPKFWLQCYCADMPWTLWAQFKLQMLLQRAILSIAQKQCSCWWFFASQWALHGYLSAMQTRQSLVERYLPDPTESCIIPTHCRMGRDPACCWRHCRKLKIMSYLFLPITAVWLSLSSSNTALVQQKGHTTHACRHATCKHPPFYIDATVTLLVCLLFVLMTCPCCQDASLPWD